MLSVPHCSARRWYAILYFQLDANIGQTYEEISQLHPDLKCIYHKDIMEYHCGRLQGITRKQALAICAKEGITYETFRSQGGADVQSFILRP